MTLADQISNIRKGLPGGSPQGQSTSGNSAGSAEKPREKRRWISPWQYLKEIVAELRKVTWPKRQAVVRGTVQVVVFSAVLAAILGGLDLGFQEVLDRILKRNAPAVEESTPVDTTGTDGSTPLQLPEGVPPPPGFEGTVETIPANSTPTETTPAQ